MGDRQQAGACLAVGVKSLSLEGKPRAPSTKLAYKECKHRSQQRTKAFSNPARVQHSSHGCSLHCYRFLPRPAPTLFPSALCTFSPKSHSASHRNPAPTIPPRPTPPAQSNPSPLTALAPGRPNRL